jgi:hypothetical protein
MKRKLQAEPKNDFFYGLVIFAMLAVLVFSVAAGYLDRNGRAQLALAGDADGRVAVANVVPQLVGASRAA